MFRQRNSFFDNIPPVTKNLIIINLIIWGFTFIAPASVTGKLLQFGALHYIHASHFNVVQMFTYMFMHDVNSFTHILFNMFALFMFGRTIESVVGSKRFLFYYISCGVGAAIIQEATWMLTINDQLGTMYGLPASEIPEAIDRGYLADLPLAYNMLSTIGASGAVYGVLLAFGMFFPNMSLYIMFIPVPIKAKWMVIGYGVIELLIGMAGARDGVAHFAHLGGMIFGLLIILYWRKKGVVNGPYY